MQELLDLILDNIGIVVFVLFMLFGVFGRNSEKPDDSTSSRPAQPQRQQSQDPSEPDGRSLAERMAEHFGVEIPELQEHQAQQTQQREQARRREGRRSTTTRSGNVQDNYPELFGGSSIFDSQNEEPTKWGFDETEWGSTFEKNDEQWGNSFPERKNSEPRIEWPS